MAMKLRQLALMLLVGTLAACSGPKSPSAAEIEAQLNIIVKKYNPEASARVSDIGFTTQSKHLVQLTFICTKCQLENAAGEKSIAETSTGKADVTLDQDTHKWSMWPISIRADDGRFAVLSDKPIF
jgi:hypothetical protein